MFILNSFLPKHSDGMKRIICFQVRLSVLSLLTIYFMSLSLAFAQNPISINDTSSYTIMVDISEDAYVCLDEPDLTHGFEEDFRVGRGSSEYYRTYLKFNLAKIPEGKTILSARLRLFCHLSNVENGFVGAHYLVNDSWNEETITWNNCPTNFSSTPADTVQTHLDYVYWQVPNDVIDAYNTDGVYSVVLKMSNLYNDKWAYFYSKEIDLYMYWPALEIEISGTKYGGGTGTAEDPYLINNAEHLNLIGHNPQDWDKHFKLTSDIDLSAFTGFEFRIISIGWQTPFTGVFNGDGHVIYNFSYTVPPDVFVDYVGLFGCIGPNSVVSNLGLVGTDVNGGANGTGSLAGLIYNGQVHNCWAADVNIYGGFNSGGLVGDNTGGQIEDSYADGGFIDAEFQNSGGLVGANDGAILRCYSTCQGGMVTGGLVGRRYSGTVTGSFWDKDVSKIAWSDGGLARTTSQMKTKSTFTSYNWDFVGETLKGTKDIWRMCVDGVKYPLLTWQFALDFVCPDGMDVLDLEFFVSKWLNQCDETSNFCNCTDTNYDQRVDFRDFAIFASYWLEGTVP